ncbi:type II toxin-antitoxin system VapC family toxin [Nocardioides sp. B-3]|nr:type II toxin-antitoxin system VapC family toxin [Nocardioides sp. B-3]
MRSAACRLPRGSSAARSSDSRSPGEAARLDRLVELLRIELVPVSAAHGRIARSAHQRYGRGSGSAAGLNFGDCFAYALAIDSGEPLLFKGDDFRHTDVRAAL